MGDFGGVRREAQEVAEEDDEESGQVQHRYFFGRQPSTKIALRPARTLKVT